MAINKRERTLLIATTSLIVLGVNFLLASYLIGKWKPLGDSLKAKRHELEGMQATIARKGDWQKEYDDLQRSLKQSHAFKNPSDVLKKIEEVGGSSGVLMKSRRMLREEQREVYRELPVSCSFEATIDSLVPFLYGVQSASGFMTVETLSVTAKPDNSGILQCEIQVRAIALSGEARGT